MIKPTNQPKPGEVWTMPPRGENPSINVIIESINEGRVTYASISGTVGMDVARFCGIYQRDDSRPTFAQLDEEAQKKEALIS